MGASWAEKLPIVDVPQGEPRPLTLIVPHYQNSRWLAQQLSTWAAYPPGVLEKLSIIVVDDCSPEGPPVEIIQKALAYIRKWIERFDFRLYALNVDVRWNWLAARNIGAYHASEGRMILTDIDHVIVGSTMERLIRGEHDPGVIYAFSRREYFTTPLAPHPNSFLLTRAMYWKVGGYDEALSGFYGTDGDWRRRCAAAAPLKVLREELVRHEHVLDSSTSRYKRKQPEDAEVKRIIARRRPSWRPKVRSFPYRPIEL